MNADNILNLYLTVVILLNKKWEFSGKGKKFYIEMLICFFRHNSKPQQFFPYTNTVCYQHLTVDCF